MIFGYTYPKVKLGTTEFLLGHSLVEPSFAEPDIVPHQSIINSFRSWKVKGGDHASFRITVNLFRFNSPVDKFEELAVLNHQYVKLMLHQDSGLWFKDIDTNEADFFITLMLPFYLKTSPPDFKDRLLIEFQSQKPLNLASALYGYLVDGVGDFLVDTAGGKKLKIKKGVPDEQKGDDGDIGKWEINTSDSVNVSDSVST